MGDTSEQANYADIRSRMVQVISDTKKSDTRFFEDMGISYNTARHWLKDGKKIGAEFFVYLPLYYPEYNLEWIITGVGEMKKGGNGHKSEFQVRQENMMLKDKLLLLQDDFLLCLKEKTKLLEQIAGLGTAGTTKK